MVFSLPRIWGGSQPAEVKPQEPAVAADHTDFFGSQVGGESVINYSYTDNPWRLTAWDIKYFFTFAWALPWVVWPMRPCDGGAFDELSNTPANRWCIFVHIVLAVIQLFFIFTLPLAFLFPAWIVVAWLIVFFTANWIICWALNGNTIVYESDPKYTPNPNLHANEQWIFLNGVAVGEAWLKSNIDRLAVTFKRPIIGVHNQTTGVIFDVIECLIQRNLGYATTDVRAAYKIVKEKLYNPQYSKVVFIMHSQGGIIGGLVLDWLIQELPQDLLAKLEIYTFGNAANHFNNPHRHVDSQEAERQHCKMRSRTQAAITEAQMTDSPVEMKTPTSKNSQSNGTVSSFGDSRVPPNLTSSSNGAITPPERTFTTPASDRIIGHVEHYAHTTDFVALWGVLHFVNSERASPELPRFIGRVFSRTSTRGGHQFCQHYLDGMFPLVQDAAGKYTGCVDSSDFMNSVVEVAKKGSEAENAREGFENSWAMIESAGDEITGFKTEVPVHGSFHGDKMEEVRDGKVRVKDLSRLWLYRNGGSPPDVPRGAIREGGGVYRGATM
ncbi:hypothetical protein F4778DRAFT_367846 [Xylariomycetidae sp. FL2044]|nr:hypothetical protein F4778DRAFT_367846 [Xylariomycetidae sp. FL2044]